MKGSVSDVWQGSDDDINVWRCSMSDSHVTVSPVLAANQSPVSGVTDQWEGRKVSQHVRMVTRYLETSRCSHATEHQRYLQMVKNIFISRPKYLAPTCYPVKTWNGRHETWGLRKAFCGTFSKSGQLVFSLSLSAYNWSGPSQHNAKTFKRSPPSSVPGRPAHWSS